MRALAAGEIEATEPDREEPAVCSTCRGAGFLRRDVPRGHPDFGRAFPCDCRAPELARQRLERVFGAADVPPRLAALSFATFALQPGADLTALTRVEAWAQEDSRASLYLYGDVGRMKTGLAYAAFRQRLEAQLCDGLFRTSTALLDAIRATFDHAEGAPRTSEVLAAAARAPLLLLDDLGAEKPSSWAVERLEALIDERYRDELPTIVTSNYDLAALGQRLSLRISSRLTDMCERGRWVVRVAGRDQRMPLGAG